MAASHTAQTKPPLDFDKLFYRDLQRQFVVDLLKNHGDFLLRRGTGGGTVLSANCNGEILHFKFNDNQREYKFDGQAFPTLHELVDHYYQNDMLTTKATGVKLTTAIMSEFEMIETKWIQLDKQLGAGNFGTVWRAKLLPASGKGGFETVAVKVLTGDCSDKDRQECLAEAKIMAILQHENVVAIRGVNFGEEAGTKKPQIKMVLEFCNAGSLDKLLEENKLTEAGKISALLDAAKGMSYLHERDIIHRDIASRNCLAHKSGAKTIVKIADFGLSRMAPDHYELATKRKLPVYAMPPESLTTREWTKSSDVWSFGILVLEMFNKGKNPYEQHFNKQGSQLKEVIQYFNKNNRLDAPKGTPKEIADLAAACMKKNPSERLEMTAVVERLRSAESKKR